LDWPGCQFFAFVYPGRLVQNFSFWGKTLDLWEKADFGPLFQEHFTKPAGFWKMFQDLFGFKKI
jgi:hypothetical protein